MQASDNTRSANWQKMFFRPRTPSCGLNLHSAYCNQLSSDEFNLQITGWLPVQRQVSIEWDLESTPLMVRTNSVLGSDERVDVVLFSAEGELAGEVNLSFTSTLRYHLDGCTYWTYLPVTPPSANDKVWRFTVTKTAGVRLVIHCNDVEVLDMLLSDATCSNGGLNTYWSRDVTKIQFSFVDTASDFYRAGD